MTAIEDAAKSKEMERFRAAIGEEGDPVMLVLRAHLFTENLLERLIRSQLPRGDKVAENANLTYFQKLVLVDALELLPDMIISSLRQLNKLRNECAHQLQKAINESDVVRIGSPLGKFFTSAKKESNFDDVVLLRKVVDYVCGFLGARCMFSEHPELLVSGENTEDENGSNGNAA